MISKLLTAGLLLFVAASVAYPLARKLGRSAAETAVNQAMPLSPNRVTVYYFHTHVRCPACRMVEASSRSAVESKYSEELISGRIGWQSIDYQSPGNQHYVEEYQLLAPSVVLVEFKAGDEARWKTLNEAWNLTGDRAALDQYIDAGIRAFQEAAR
jgi:hypothetical protein